MTSEYNRRPSKRAARAGRNRPELVVSADDLKNEPPVPEANQQSEEAAPTTAEPIVTPRTRKLASFFSTVGRSEKTQDAQATDVAQARLARATRAKTTTTAKEDQKSEVSEGQEPVKTSAPARTAPTRPPSLLKPRYLLGFFLYIFGAQYIGAYERVFLVQNHLNSELARFPLFGGIVVIDTTTLVYLATLLVLLILLTRIDLFPRNLGALMGQQPASRSTSNSRNTSESAARNIPPPMKQGVKGADDDLYQEYRANQRRAKKR